MSVRQDRVNPSTYIANWKGRTNTPKAWPGTSVSTWLNGGLYGGGGSDNWVMSIDLSPGDALGDYGYSWGCYFDRTNEKLYWVGGTAGLGSTYPRIGKMDADGNQEWAYLYNIDSSTNWSMNQNGGGHWVDTGQSQAGTENYLIFNFKAYNQPNSSYPAAFWRMNPSTGEVDTDVKIGDSYGWQQYTYGQSVAKDTDNIYFPIGFWSNFSGNGANIVKFNHGLTMKYNVRLFNGSPTSPGTILYGPGSTVSNANVCMQMGYGRLTYAKHTNINGTGNLAAVGQMMQVNTTFGTYGFYSSGWPGTGNYTFPLRQTQNSYKLGKMWPDNNTTGGTWFKEYSLTSPGTLADIRDGYGGNMLAMDSSSNSYFIARDYGGGHAFQDALYLAKVDIDGNLEWSRAFKFTNTAISSPGSSPPYRAGVDCSDDHVYIHVGLADGDGYNYIIKYKNDGAALGTVSLPGNWSCEVMAGTMTDAAVSSPSLANATQNANGASLPYSAQSMSSSRGGAQTPTLVKENI